MSLAELQAELADCGCKLWVEGDILRFKAPEGALKPPLMARLKRNKKALIESLRQQAQPGRSARTQGPSFGQQAMWLMHERTPDSPAYNVASALRINSEVDIAALERVWRTLIARHDSLRSTFEACGGQLVVRVRDEPPVDMRQIVVDGETDAQLQARVVSAYAKPFDLSRGPLARLRLFTAAPNRHVLLLSMHHIVLDAWSLWVLLEELGELYAQEARGEVGVLPTVEARYADFVHWQQEMPNTEAGRAQWSYWKEQLADNPEPARLPWDRPRPERADRRGESLHFRLPSELAEELRELGRQRGATPFVTLLSVFQTLVHRHSAQTDFLVGTTTSGRSQKRFNRLVGYLVNTLPLRTRIEPGMRFVDLLEQSRQTAIEGIAAQDFPFPLMVERLNPPREAGALPLCRVMFGLQKPHQFSDAMQAMDGADQTIDWGGLSAATFPLDQQEGQFDLTLEMYETTSTFLGLLKYDPKLLDRESAQLIAERYEHLASQLVANPETLLDELDLTTDRDRQLSADAAAALCSSVRGRVEQRFGKCASETPDAVALMTDDRRMTYRELDEQTNRVAAWLLQRGVRPGDAVACCMTRGADGWIAQLACFKAGAVYVPLDEAGPPSRICQLLRDCQAKLLLSDSHVAKRLELAVADLPVKLELIDDEAEAIAEQPSTPVAAESAAADDAYVIYTSGSTGAPKGVVVTHEALGAHIDRAQQNYRIMGDDRVLQFSAMTFDPSLEQAWTAWSAGATLVVRGPQLWSASEFWSRVERDRVSVANLPPAYFSECSKNVPRCGRGDSLRLVIVGGDAFPAAALENWRDSGTQILNAYGPTEAVITATVADVTKFDLKRGPLPIGKPLAGTTAYVVDSGDRPCPIGIPGELLLSGPALASRYLGDERLTTERFRPAPTAVGDDRLVYRTGDRVRWNHRGELEFLGRVDRQVKINGYRIELGEVERTLEAVTGVAQAVARVQQSPSGESKLVAYYATEAEVEVSSQMLLAAARARLPHYMTPAAVAAVESFPLNSAGKIAADQLPDVEIDAAGSSERYAAPENEVQRILSEVWSTVLGVERVGIHDDFFELGGASLKSLQIVSEAEAKGVRLGDESMSPAMLFEYPTIAQLAEQLIFAEGGSEAGVPATT